MSAPTPQLIQIAFASGASGSYVNVIPVPSQVGVDPALASYTTGFPPDTMLDVLAGGLPPYGQDVNGILKAITTNTVYVTSGQPYYYNSTLSAAISGYALGAYLGMTDGAGIWQNITANNTTDPDGGGAGWVPAFTYGNTTVTVTGGSTTLTTAQTRFAVIFFNGTLTSNQTIILPNTLQTWLLINSTTGAHTLTAKTVAGTGVVIPQSGPSAPNSVWGDGTNIYNVVAPLSVAIDQAATALTLAERDNTGQLLATRFNQSSSSTENPAVIGAVFVENGAGDGYLRKATLAYLLSKFQLSDLGASGSATANGYIKLPLGIILQWGSVPVGDIVPQPGRNTVNISFPISFPTSIFQLFTSILDTTGGVGGPVAYESTSNSSGATVLIGEINPGVQNVTLRWFSIGH